MYFFLIHVILNQNRGVYMDFDIEKLNVETVETALNDIDTPETILFADVKQQKKLKNQNPESLIKKF